jgi:hypothetical protein
VAGGLGNAAGLVLGLGGLGGGYHTSSGVVVLRLSLGSPVSSRGRTKRWSPKALCRRDAIVPSGISRAGRMGVGEGEKDCCWLSWLDGGHGSSETDAFDKTITDKEN